LREGFQEEYIDPYDIVGETVQEIEDNITAYCSNPEPYNAPYTSLITSSMMGKSRLMKEIARTLPSVYICFRLPSQTGYPTSTPKLLEWITKGVDSELGSNTYEVLPDMLHMVRTYRFCILLLVLIE